MALNYYLIPNHISNGADNFIAVSSNTETYTIEDVFDEIVHPGSSINKAEALATFEALTEGAIHFFIWSLLNVTVESQLFFTE